MSTRADADVTERETVTDKTFQLVERWDHAVERVERLRQELNSAECEQRNAETALGKWLVPADAQEGEQYNIWFGARIVTVLVNTPAHDFTVSIRKPKER